MLEFASGSPEEPRIRMLSTLDSLQAYKGNRVDLFMEQLSYRFALEVKFHIQRVLKQIFGEIFEYLLSGGNQAK